MKHRFILSFVSGLALLVAVAPVRADGLTSVAKRLTKGLENIKPKRVAVLSFPYVDGNVSSGSSIISERLLTLLVERGDVQVVERALLDKALGEIRLGMTGVLDPATTQKLGKILGVSAIVTGTLNDLEGDRTEVNARLIQTESGAILAAAMTTIQRTWPDSPHKPYVSENSSARDDGTESHLHMSKLIATHSMRGSRPPLDIYSGPIQSLPTDSGQDSDPVLSLSNDDLIPLHHRGMTDPAAIVDDFQARPGTPPPYALSMARRIYHNNPDPAVRGRALMAMGNLLERSGQPAGAAHAYSQVLREFPDQPIDNNARQRLDALTAAR